MSSTRVDRHVNIKKKNVMYSTESNETETMGLSQGCMWQRGAGFQSKLFFSIAIRCLAWGNILNPTILPQEKLIQKRKDFPGVMSYKGKEYRFFSALWKPQSKPHWKATLAIICDNIKKRLQFLVGKLLEFNICDQYLSISWCSFIRKKKKKSKRNKRKKKSKNNKTQKHPQKTKNPKPLWIKSGRV